MGKGARLQAVDKDGDTALHWAAFKGRLAHVSGYLTFSIIIVKCVLSSIYVFPGAFFKPGGECGLVTLLCGLCPIMKNSVLLSWQAIQT